MLNSELIAKIRALDIKIQRLVSQDLAGEYKTAFKGSGLEFSHVRAYEPGDDFRRIDWSVSSRNQKWYVREYQEERQIRLVTLLDVSASLSVRFSGVSKIEIGREIAALFTFLAQKNNDLAGLVTLTSEVEHYIEPRNGKTHFFQLLSHLFSHQPSHKKTSLQTGLHFLLQTQKKRSIIMIISDFLDENWEDELLKLQKKHEVKLIRLYHPEEYSLSIPGFAPMEEAENGNTFWHNPFQKKKKFLINPEEKLKKLHKQGFSCLSLDISQDYFPKLGAFLRGKG